MLDKNEAYKYKLYRRIATGLGLAILGLVVVMLFWTSAETTAIYRGTGCGLMGGGFTILFRAWRLLRHPEHWKAEHILETDERMQHISNEASRLAGVVTVGACVIGALLLAPANPSAAWALFAMLVVFFVVFLAAYFWLSKKL